MDGHSFKWLFPCCLRFPLAEPPPATIQIFIIRKKNNEKLCSLRGLDKHANEDEDYIYYQFLWSNYWWSAVLQQKQKRSACEMFSLTLISPLEYIPALSSAPLQQETSFSPCGSNLPRGPLIGQPGKSPRTPFPQLCSELQSASAIFSAFTIWTYASPLSCG